MYKLQAPPIWIRPCMSHHVHIFKHHPSHNPPRRQCNEVKVKFTLGHEGPEAEQMYSSTLPSTSAIDGDGLLNPRSGRFTPGKDPVSILQEAGWATGPVWTGAENLTLTGIRSPDRPARCKLLYRLS